MKTVDHVHGVAAGAHRIGGLILLVLGKVAARIAAPLYLPPHVDKNVLQSPLGDEGHVVRENDDVSNRRGVFEVVDDLGNVCSYVSRLTRNDKDKLRSSSWHTEMAPHDRRRMLLTVLEHGQVDVVDQRVERLNRAIADGHFGVASHDFLSSIDGQASEMSWKSRRRHSQAGLRLLYLGLLQLFGCLGCLHARLGVGGKGDVGNHVGIVD